MYKPNPNCYGAMFAIPAIAADQYLAEASGDDLKVLLCIFRDPSGGISIDNLSAALNLSADKVLASLDFWVSRGVLLFTDEQGNTKFVPRAQRAAAPEMPAQKPVSPLPAAKPAVVHTLPTPEIPKPTMEQIAARLAEDDTVKSLFLEAQHILGRTFGLDVQSTLLTLYDTYGLQKEVILTLLQHLTEKGRNTRSSVRLVKFGHSTRSKRWTMQMNTSRMTLPQRSCSARLPRQSGSRPPARRPSRRNTSFPGRAWAFQPIC